MNNIAVITGAASGLGKSLSQMAYKRGLNLVLVDADRTNLETLAHDIYKSNTNQSNKMKILTHVGNVSDVNTFKAVSELTVKELGYPNYIFNNAGISRSGFCWEHSPNDWKSFLDVNIMGTVNGIHIFTPLMLTAAKKNSNYFGHFINTASMAGLVSMPLSGMYNVSKHAIVTLSETLYHDLQFLTNKISVSVICPFFFSTDINNSIKNINNKVIAQYHMTPSEKIGNAFLNKAVSSGKISSDTVAEIVFNSIDKKQFYIYTHPNSLETVKTRFDDILQQRNPSSPYGTKSDIADKLKASLLEAYVVDNDK